MSQSFDGKKTVALDFDGVLHDYHGWNGGKLAGPILGAREAVLGLLAVYKVIIFSTRAASVIEEWLVLHNFPPLEVTNTKPLCVVLVDDRAIQFAGVWSAALLDNIKNFRAHWE